MQTNHIGYKVDYRRKLRTNRVKREEIKKGVSRDVREEEKKRQRSGREEEGVN